MNKNIGKYSVGYALLKLYLQTAHNKLYYRKVTVTGEENIPKDGPVIFAANHPNHLMDPLAILFTLPGQPVFMARADIFQSKFLAKILNGFKILPIYRQRDGFKTVQNRNEAIAEIVVDHLLKKRKLVIHPEGSTVQSRKVRPLKKGLARLAFQTAEAGNFDLDLKIVPAGIHYGNFSKHGSELLVQYGEPIMLKDYFASYHENSVVTINQLTKDIHIRMMELTPHFKDQDVSDLTMIEEQQLMDTPQSERFLYMQDYANRLAELKESDPAAWTEVQESYKHYRNTLAKGGVKERNLHNFSYPVSNFNMVAAVLASPLALWGTLHHMPSLFLSHKLASIDKDPESYSMMRYASSALTLPIFYGTYMGAMAYFTDWQTSLVYGVSLPLTAFIATRMRNTYEHVYFRGKFHWLKSTKKKLFEQIKASGKSLQEKIKDMDKAKATS
ncbi:1-acyl-sn-glycerol-3-phosphate acyltransferase [Limibacter armeniacum]|uniref:1-acyl-sn-glycerol-3-phosphate acyltransferase n=1 Tax=Limibacter armeniacum TaxID=466084 RepID=UPI002FE58816